MANVMQGTPSPLSITGAPEHEISVSGPAKDSPKSTYWPLASASTSPSALGRKPHHHLSNLGVGSAVPENTLRLGRIMVEFVGVPGVAEGIPVGCA